MSSTLILPFAHAGHVLIDLPIYLGPVVAIAIWLKVANWREKRSKAKGDLEGGGDGRGAGPGVDRR
jgi:hypothetical protein